MKFRFLSRMAAVSLVALCFFSLLISCSAGKAGEKIPENITEDAVVEGELAMSIDGQRVSVQWEDNESVAALMSLVSKKALTVNMSMYGGFEQVGDLGSDLPRDDSQTTTSAGDIVLYSGDQLVVFYGSNSWAYTRLGIIQGLSSSDLQTLLGTKAVKLTLSLE